MRAAVRLFTSFTTTTPLVGKASTLVGKVPALVQTCSAHHLAKWQRDDKIVAERFRHLPGSQEAVFLTYIWVDGTDENVRAKTKVVDREPQSYNDVSPWHYDGSSTYQATGMNSDLILHPVAMCHDPFFVGRSKLVMCDVYDADLKPIKTNKRNSCQAAYELCKDQEPWFGFEQEYTLLGTDGKPYGFPEFGNPDAQGPYYCSAGAGLNAGRDIADAHLLACKFAGLEVSGTNAEVLLGQWEYQVGVCTGIEVADQLWLSRFILHRVAEEFGARVSLDPKPISGDWNGTGNHCNFSTKVMREAGGLKHIWDAIKKLEKRHKLHIENYDPKGGEDNRRRMTGKHETATFDQFSAGEGTRTTSVRIPRPVVNNGKGWLEDRRPSANCDPYTVVDLMLRTVCLDEDDA